MRCNSDETINQRFKPKIEQLQGHVVGRNILQGHRPALGAGGRASSSSSTRSLHSSSSSSQAGRAENTLILGVTVTRALIQWSQAARGAARRPEPSVCLPSARPCAPCAEGSLAFRSGPVKKKHAGVTVITDTVSHITIHTRFGTHITQRTAGSCWGAKYTTGP